MPHISLSEALLDAEHERLKFRIKSLGQACPKAEVRGELRLQVPFLVTSLRLKLAVPSADCGIQSKFHSVPWLFQRYIPALMPFLAQILHKTQKVRQD